MIKANELRLHNITEDGIVSSIFRSHFCVTDKNGIVRNSAQYNIRPIPLTPEILEKCPRFKKWPSSSMSEIDTTEGIIQITGDDVFLGGQESQTSSMGFKTKVKYLHQLQNLHFSLFGEELEVKL